ncbi:hypothetical protein BN2537_1891 [Streptomyces venezuelae]|nr:hypothetical protein BN2537_1891 [Streptomyces venezuelae]
MAHIRHPFPVRTPVQGLRLLPAGGAAAVPAHRRAGIRFQRFEAVRPHQGGGLGRVGTAGSSPLPVPLRPADRTRVVAATDARRLHPDHLATCRMTAAPRRRGGQIRLQRLVPRHAHHGLRLLGVGLALPPTARPAVARGAARRGLLLDQVPDRGQPRCAGGPARGAAAAPRLPATGVGIQRFQTDRPYVRLGPLGPAGTLLEDRPAALFRALRAPDLAGAEVRRSRGDDASARQVPGPPLRAAPGPTAPTSRRTRARPPRWLP